MGRRRVKLAPLLLAADFSRLGEQVAAAIGRLRDNISNVAPNETGTARPAPNH
jgi:hypothetical protein